MVFDAGFVMANGNVSCKLMDEAFLNTWLKHQSQLWPDISCEEQMRQGQHILSFPDRYVSLLGIDDKDQIMGFADATVRDDYVNGCESSPVVYLEGIFVILEQRCRGIAEQLIIAIQDWGLTKGCSEMASDAPLNNHVSHQMHQALGFKETERVVFFKKKIAS